MVFLTIAVAISLAVAACGGGGSNGDTSANVSSYASPQYASGSVQLSVFQLLNAYRVQCGFPALKENPSLDTSSAKHLAYLKVNGIAPTYGEVATASGFYGVSPQAREQVAGYPYSTLAAINNEAIGQTSYANQSAAAVLTGLLSLPYSALAALSPANADVGIAAGQVTTGPNVAITTGDSGGNVATSGSTNSAGTGYYSAILDFGVGAAASSAPVQQSPLTFPCQGTTGVPYQSAAADMQPPSGINTATNPIGTPIFVMGNPTDTLVLNSATITGPSGVSSSITVLDSGKDTNHVLTSAQAVAFPTSPLLPSTTYSATILGTINGAGFTRSITFTTGA